MDNTLKRPLFKQKAMEAYKAKHGGKIPGYAIGGIMPVYNTLRAAAAPTFRFLGKVGRTTTRKAPGITGAAEGATGLYFGSEGIQDIGEGLYTGDYGQVALGLGELGLGGLGSLRGARTLGMSKPIKNIRGVKQTKDAARLLEQKIPKGTGLGSLAFLGTGAVFSDAEGNPLPEKPEEMSQAEYQADLVDRLITTKPTYKREELTKKELEEVPKIFGMPAYKKKLEVDQKGGIPIGIKDPRTQGEAALNKQLETVNTINNIAKKLGVDDPAKATEEQIKQIAIESNVAEKDLRKYIGRETKVGINTSDTAPMPGGLTGNETEAELQYLKDKRNKDLTAAKELGTNNLATGFKNFRSEINKMVGGGNENLNDLVAMKVAARLLTGKTNQSGFAGLADVGGQALGVGADTLLAIKLAQRDSDMKLAQAYLQAVAKKKQVGGPKIAKSGDRTIRVQDPSVPGGFRNVRVAYDENTGNFLERKFDPVRGQFFEPAQFTGTDVKINQDKLNQALMNLEENRRGGKMVEFVINNAQKGGIESAFGLLTEDALGTLDFFGGGNLGADSSAIDDQIRAEMNKNTKDGFFSSPEAEKMNERFSEDLQDARENGAKRVEKQLKKAKIIGKGYRPTEEDLRIYTQLALIEQRMKYIVANANKSEDRLTQKDIDNAAKRTQIIKYIASPRTIRLNYESLQQEFDEKAATFLSQYKLNGGEEQFIIQNFMDIPGVKRQYDKSEANFASQQAAADKLSRDEILTSIVGG